MGNAQSVKLWIPSEQQEQLKNEDIDLGNIVSILDGKLYVVTLSNPGLLSKLAKNHVLVKVVKTYNTQYYEVIPAGIINGRQKNQT